jgi:hypothetical protein
MSAYWRLSGEFALSRAKGMVVWRLKLLARRRGYHKHVVRSMTRRRQLREKRGIFWGWKCYAEASSHYLGRLTALHGQACLIKAVRSWRARAVVGARANNGWMLASAHLEARRAAEALAVWSRAATFRRWARRLGDVALEHWAGARQAAYLRALWRAGRRLRRAHQLVRCAARYRREFGLRGALRGWCRRVRFHRAFVGLQQRALVRRVMLRWRDVATRDADVRAFTMALSCREECLLKYTHFHGWSIYASRRTRLRRCFEVVAVMAAQNLAHAALKTWAQTAIVKRRDLTLVRRRGWGGGGGLSSSDNDDDDGDDVVVVDDDDHDDDGGGGG